MTMTVQELLALANEVAEQSHDMNIAVKGGGGARLLPEGYAYCRLVEYIEFGMQPQEFGGKQKDPALEFQLGFALYDTADRKYQNDDGSPYITRPYTMAMSANEKARSYLLFKLLNWQGKFRHFGQLLTQPFLAKIVHEPKSKTDPKIVSRIDLKGFLPPLDAVSGMPLPVPEARPEDLKAFFWERPNKAVFDSFYVEGKWDDGRSKNIIQETMLAAVDFESSPLKQLLMGANFAALPAAPETAPAAPLPPGAGYAPAFTPPAAPAPAPVAPSLPAAPGVAPAVPLAQTPVAPAAAVAPQLPSVPVLPVAPVIPSATPAGLQTTYPSSPALPQ